MGAYTAVGNGINLEKAKACKAGVRSSQSTYLTAEQRGTVLKVSYCMFYPARMPVVYSRSDVLSVPLKTRSQKCTGMYIFDDVVAVGFRSLHQGLESSARIKKSANRNELIEIFCRSGY